MRLSYLILQPLSSLGGDDGIRRTLDLVVQSGYAGIELNLTPSLIDSLAPLEGWLADRGLTLPAFCTGEAYHEGLCLSSPDPGVRQRAVQRLLDYLPVARHFGALLVVGMMQGTLQDEPDPAVANLRIVESLRQVGVAADKAGVGLVIEPVDHLIVGFNNTVAEVRQLIEQIGSPAFRPMVDTVHMNIEERSLTQPIYDCGAALGHVHLCESNGAQFGTGRVDFASVLQALYDIGYDGFASLKVYRRPSLAHDIRANMEHLRFVAPSLMPIFA